MDVHIDPTKPNGRATHAGAVVLFVDDEAVLGDLARAALTRAGYSAIVTHDGTEALRHVETESARIDVAIIDWNMPGMGGRELLASIRLHRPSLPVVISSGSGDAETQDAQARDAAIYVLPKPWRMRALIELVESITVAVG